MESTERRFDARFWSLIAAIFLGFSGIGTVLPALAPHVRHDLGGSDQDVGWVIGTFSLVALGSRFFSGPLADRRGRKLTFLTGLFSCALAGVAYVSPLGMFGAYLARTLQGFGEACLYTGAATWAVEVAGVSRSGQALGYVSSGIWGGLSAGPVIGQHLGSFHNAALLQVFAAIVAFILALYVREDFRPEPHPPKRVWIPKSLLVPGLAIGFVNMHYPVITGFLILHLANHGNSGPKAFSAYALMVLLSRFFLGGLPDRNHPGITFYSGLTAMAVGLLILASGPPPTLAIAGAGLLGLGFSFPWSSVASTVLRRTPSAQHGSTVSFLSAFYDIFVGISSVLAGGIAQRQGYPAAFVMAAIALAGAAFFGHLVFRNAEAPASAHVTPVEEQPAELV